MSSGTECAICFGEYTVEGNHSIVSLKCGHIFGKDCIEKWLFEHKKRICPTCSAPVKKIQLRPLFVEGIKAFDSGKEEELIEKYRAEHEIVVKQQKELLDLKVEIEVLKLRLDEQKVVVSQFTYPNILKKSVGLCFEPYFSIVDYDPLNEIIVVSCRKNGEFGLFLYNSCDFTIQKFLPFSSIISALKVSPYKDGLCLVAAGRVVYLLNLVNRVVVYEEQSQEMVSAVDFDMNNRNRIVYGTNKGEIFCVDLFNNISEEIGYVKHAVNGIAFCYGHIYIYTLFNAYCIKFFEEEKVHTLERLNMPSPGIFTGLSACTNRIFLSIRDKEGMIHAYLSINQKEQISCLGIEQKQKHRNRIIDNHLAIVNGGTNQIVFFDTECGGIRMKVEVPDKIVDFNVKEKKMIVLGEKKLFIFE